MKPIVQNIQKALLIAVIAILGASSVFALTPPVNIGHTIKTQNPLKVELWFIIDDMDTDAVEYSIYQATGQTEDLALFSKIGKVTRQSKEKYYYTVENLTPGTYTFFVKSVDQAGVESLRSKVTVVKSNNEESSKINLEGKIPESVCRGKELRIEFKSTLKNTDASQFRYELLNAPEGMTISQSGLLEWNISATTNSTTVSFGVRVSVEGKPEATTVKQVSIKIKNCDEAPKDELTFNEPKRKACIDKEYEYLIGAKYKGARENVQIRYTVMSGPDGISINSETGLVQYNPKELGVDRIVILIEALVGNDVIIRKELVIEVKVTNCDENNDEKAGLRFVSTPRKEICLLNDNGENSTYRYESRAIISKEAKGTVTYALLQSPDGMTISANGLVEWSNISVGEYEIVIEATTTLEDGTVLRSEQKYVLRVKDCKKETPKEVGCAVIEGTISTGANSVGGEGSIVTLWRIDLIDQSGNDVKNVERIYRAKVMNGRYEIKVPAGTYKLRIEGAGIVSEWFENVREGADATEVNVSCDDNREVNFDVERKQELAPMMIRGKVSDIVNGSAIGGAKVTLRPILDNLKNGTDMPRHSTTTNSEGMFVITVPGGMRYIAYTEAQGYSVLYFDGVSDATGAKPISSENSENVNFALSMQAGTVQGISGTILSETGAGIVGKVIAYQIKDEFGANSDRKKRPVFTVESDVIGNYSFKAMLPGNYIFLAIPMDVEFAPGYYQAGSASTTPNWQSATVVSVGDIMPTVQYNIIVGVRAGEKGLGSMRGKIRERKNAGIIVLGSEELPTISGAIITIYDENKEISAVSISTFDGTFEVKEISIGSFNYVAEKVGFNQESGFITVDAQGNINVDKDIELLPLIDVTSVNDKENVALTAYPNPSTSRTSVQFDGNGSQATIALYNTMGVQVMSMNTPTNVGSTTVVLSLGNVSTGMYTVKVTNGSFFLTTPISVVR